jgi:hypothetical protein
VVFGGLGANNQQGIYAWAVDPAYPTDPIRIADRNTAVPPGNLGHFGGFTPNSETPPDPCISGRRVAFYANTDRGAGIYSATLDGAITTIADTTTPTPGTSVGDHFVAFYVYRADPSISGNRVAFCGYSGNGSNSITPGVYLSTDGVLARVADNTTAIPGGTGIFADFQTFDTSPGGPQVSSCNVLFWGKGSSGQQGLYVKTPVDPMKVVASAQTAIPGGSGTFTGFSAMSLSGDAVAFVGLGTGGQMGIYVVHPQGPIHPADPMFPSDPMKVLDLNDTLDGKTITGLQLSRTGLDRDHNLLAFGATFSDGTQGLYTLNVFTGLRITSAVRTGANLQLSFTSQVGHKYNVQSFTYLVNGVVRDVATGIPGNGSIVQTTVSNAFVYSQQFYRIEQAP